MLPLFPLNLVAFPGETVSLHIFEPRYRQLVHDCLESGSPFGIPPYINASVKEYGSLMEISQVARAYDDGRMDLRSLCTGRFWMMQFFPTAGEKLYSGGEVALQPLTETGKDVDQRLKEVFLTLVKDLFNVLEHPPKKEDMEADFVSFTFGHKVGLSIEQEYKMLLMDRENDRLRYLTDHLERTLPAIKEKEHLLNRVRMNGHFQSFDPLNF